MSFRLKLDLSSIPTDHEAVVGQFTAFLVELGAITDM